MNGLIQCLFQEILPKCPLLKTKISLRKVAVVRNDHYFSNFKQVHKHIKVIVDQKINQGCKASDHLQLKANRKSERQTLRLQQT